MISVSEAAMNPPLFHYSVEGACIALRVMRTMQVLLLVKAKASTGCTWISETRLPSLLLLNDNGFSYFYMWQHPPSL